MAIKKAFAYDTIGKKWIGRVPLTWFATFPHLSHEGPGGERPPVAKLDLRADAAQFNETAQQAAAATSAAGAAAAPLLDGPLEDMTVKQLRAVAEHAHVDLAGAARKADIIAAINHAGGQVAE